MPFSARTVQVLAAVFMLTVAVAAAAGSEPTADTRTGIHAESPDLRALDSLGTYYLNNATTVLFETPSGPMVFSPEDIRVATLDSEPHGSNVAWVRIGKTESTDSGLLIKDWSLRAMAALWTDGYRALPVQSGEAEYGPFGIFTYEKGDMYFRFYTESIRVQGTYGRTSVVRTFYFERGCKSRRDRFDAQQYGGR